MYADRPAETFFLFHRARRILFLMFQKENGGRIGASRRRGWIPRPMGRTGRIPRGTGPRREPVWGRPQSSHSPLWASHHAGNAGSFGERVGLTGFSLKIREVSFFAQKGSIRSRW